ncbi:unnamed protein product [Microthlaspi erraticum]|uniref:F-box domain-containing protein n=1 Tax=Microthlaspi erraticum TaxID=1685480 RepID=A0A6D2KTS4_9BRAS|nr:unnamed protein product [Microthlaspi erraticum]
MTIGEFPSESLGTSLLPSLPEDIFAVISRSLSPSDICNLSFCSKSLCALVGSEEIWLAQCELVKALPLSEILQWRIGIRSYKVLCRFLVEVMKPLAGIWVQRNPELGNVVYVMPGFLSLVGCRMIPQRVGPLGIQEGRVVWSPVFEIICGFDGSNKFFLHGRDGKDSCLYPGFVTGIEKTCNVLHLEVEPRREKKLLCSEIDREEASRKVSFSELTLKDKTDLLELVTSHVGLHDGSEPLAGRLFPTSKDDESMSLERRTMLLKMHKFGGNWKHKNLEEEKELCYNPMHVDIERIWKNLAHDNKDIDSDDDDNDFGDYHDFMDYKESKKEHRQSFLSAGDTFGLSLRASYDEVSSYLGWPDMSYNHFSLYKIPVKSPMKDQVYAGLWGGTFGWPPGTFVEDYEGKTGNAFYLLMLTYEQSQEDRGKILLVGQKILEGTEEVKRPTGSNMFVVDVDAPSLEPFPFDADGREFEHSFQGDGIADGYGFRNTSSVPGSLYVISNDHLAFVWRETRDVFTLQRLNLEEILKRGLGVCVPPLRPTMNFTYMERLFHNVFL